jgi:DNA-binding beta-propeller fold protein YncE
MQSVTFALAGLCLLASAAAGQSSASFGEVIALSGTPADIVLDEARERLYLVSTPGNRVDVYDYRNKVLAGWIDVGQAPLGAAMSMDGAFLYVANHDSSTLSVIDLNAPPFGAVSATASLPAKPQGVAAGFDGRVLICTDGSGTGNTSNTLLLFDARQETAYQVLTVPFPLPPATPPTLQPLVATVNPLLRSTSLYNGRLQRTPDGKFIVGVSSITNNTSTVVYVYEVASASVLRIRTVVGQSSTMSMSPDGATFMAGFTLYDINTLNAIGQQSTANAPFAMTSTFAATFNVGGSVFAPGGGTLYSAFNTAALTNPPPSPTASTLLISDPRSLAIRMGINLPESILSKMVMTADGNNIWALSSSGVLYLPISTLYDYPILMPESTVVFLAQDDCHPGVAKVTLKISNIGGGTLTFAVPQTIPGGTAALVVTAASGVAPSTVTFTMDPGRSGVIRTPGTNLYTGGGTNNAGTAVNLQLVSPNAINVPPTIRVYMNYRDTSMRGIVYPVATVPNSGGAGAAAFPGGGAGGAAAAQAYEGLHDIVLDEARKRVYITNAGYNRIEVFDTEKLRFLDPIPVGQLPHQMAMGLDGYTLYVATTGGESVQIVDLDLQQVVGSIAFPPVPRAGNAAITFVRGMAMGLSGLQLVTSNGNLWRVVNDQALPRIGTSITGVTAAGAQTPIAGPVQTMIASADGQNGILLGGNGTAYLYDGLLDSYTASRQLFTNPIIGYYGPLAVAPEADFLLANGLVLNQSLTVIGGAASPGQLTITPPMPGGPGQPGGGPAIGVSSTGLRNIATTAAMSENLFVRMSTPVRNNLTAATNDDVHTILEAVDTRSGAGALAARMPDNPVLSQFGTVRTNLPPRAMVIDSQGIAYALTLSGLSVVPLTPANSTTQPRLAPTRPVVNSADGTTSFRPGSFITVSGANLASTAAADTLPPPDVLGGSCVLINDVAIPLLSTSAGQIAAQVPANARTGLGVLQVRSLATAQQSARITINIQRP